MSFIFLLLVSTLPFCGAEADHATDQLPLNLKHVCIMQEAHNDIPSKHGWCKGKGKAHRFRDHSGEIHGKLTIKSFVRMHPRNGAVWLGQCECGNSREVFGGSLKRGTIKSCKKCIVMKAPTHGETVGYKPSTEYMAFMSMKSRCYNPSAANFKRYGGRGVSVCEEWLQEDGFDKFLQHLGRKPADKDSVDRWPNRNGNYEPGNVRWATSEEQSGNRDCNRFVTFQGETLCATQMARKYGIQPATLISRLRSGYSPEKAITTPIKHKKTKYV